MIGTNTSANLAIAVIFTEDLSRSLVKHGKVEAPMDRYDWRATTAQSPTALPMTVCSPLSGTYIMTVLTTVVAVHIICFLINDPYRVS
jgi:hypothetical protein